MKTISLHLAKNILISTLIALGVLTFVMLSGHFFKAFELLSAGVSPAVLGKFLLLMIPDMLRFTLPLSILVATVLVFGRMSSDNEIVALKASGINLWQIIAPGLAISAVFSALCLTISLVLSPLCRYKAETMSKTALATASFSMIEPGTFTAITARCHLRIAAQHGNEWKDIHLILQNSDHAVQDITAASGHIRLDQETQMLELELKDALLTDIVFEKGSRTDDVASTSEHDGLPISTEPDRHAVTKQQLRAKSIRLPIDFNTAQKNKSTTRKPKFMDVKMLFSNIRLLKQNGGDVTSLMLNLHHRLSLSLAPFAFLLLGIPFGIRGKRSELSVGLLICVILALGFYVFLLLASMLEKKPQFHPELIVWIPNLLYQGGGLFALHKLSKH